MKKEAITAPAPQPIPAPSRRRVRSVTLTVRWADEPPTLGELVEDLRAVANSLATRQAFSRRSSHED